MSPRVALDADAITRAEAASILAVHIAVIDSLILRGVLTPGRKLRKGAPITRAGRLWCSLAHARPTVQSRIGSGLPTESFREVAGVTRSATIRSERVSALLALV